MLVTPAAYTALAGYAFFPRVIRKLKIKILYTFFFFRLVPFKLLFVLSPISSSSPLSVSLETFMTRVYSLQAVAYVY